MIGEDLLVLHRPIARPAGQPLGELLVQLAAQLLGHRLVGSVPDHDVSEPEGILAGERRGIRHHQLFARQGLEIVTDTRARRLSGDNSDTAPHQNVLPITDAALGDRLFIRAELVETGCDQRVDRRWDGEI